MTLNIATIVVHYYTKMPKVLLSVAGATGIGKTALAIAIAKSLQTEIISADSRQFYEEMRIGTAVPTADELSQVKHHFIQHRSIYESYSVGTFREDALDLLQDLFKTHDTVVMVGGSGLYLDAVTQGLDDFPVVEPGIREHLIKQFQEGGLNELQELLKKHDSEYYRQVDLQNPHRLIRALEVCLSSGQPFSSFVGNRKAPNFFLHLPIGLTAPREIIYKRIEARVDQMLAEGLLEEVRALFPFQHLNALQTVGYQELFRYLEGEITLEMAISLIKQNTRRFAKRQGTWFRRHQDILWFDRDSTKDLILDRVHTALKSLEHAE